MVKAFEKGSGKTIPYKIAPRRSGDVAACYADPTKAATELSWHAEKGLEDMCADTWNWQSQNPMGYPKDQFLSDQMCSYAQDLKRQLYVKEYKKNAMQLHSVFL